MENIIIGAISGFVIGFIILAATENGHFESPYWIVTDGMGWFAQFMILCVCTGVGAAVGLYIGH